MNVLIVSYLFPPILNPQSIMSGRVAKYLNKNKNNISVITVDNPILFESTHGIDLDLLNGLTNVKIYTFHEDRRKLPFENIYRKVIYHEEYRAWSSDLYKVIDKVINQNHIDLIYSLSAPLSSNITGYKIKQQTGLPWIAHFSDPGVIALNLKFKSPIRNYLSQKVERDIISNADGLTFVNQPTLDNTLRDFPGYYSKSTVIPHCYDPELFSEEKLQKQNQREINVSYIGSLYSRRQPFEILDTIQEVNDTLKFSGKEILFHIYGTIDLGILNRLEGSNYSSLRIHGSITYLESIKAMIESDYLLLIDMPQSKNLYTPSKLFDYIASRTPIIGISDQESESSIILKNIGYPVVSPGDSSGLKNILMNISQTNNEDSSKNLDQWLLNNNADVMALNLVHFFSRFT